MLGTCETGAVSLSSAPKPARFSAASLTRPAGFSGVDGPVRFTAQGTSERGLAVIEVQAFGTNVIDPAPASFTGATKVSEAAPPPPQPRTN